MCFKTSARITEGECRRLIGGDHAVLMENGSPLMRELYAKMSSQLLRPVNIVDYWREAYIYPAGNVRVTIDSDLRGSENPRVFLQEKIVAIPVPDALLLEVKYDVFLPEIIGVAERPTRRRVFKICRHKAGK
jgi:hypothetical protein